MIKVCRINYFVNFAVLPRSDKFFTARLLLIFISMMIKRNIPNAEIVVQRICCASHQKINGKKISVKISGVSVFFGVYQKCPFMVYIYMDSF